MPAPVAAVNPLADTNFVVVIVLLAGVLLIAAGVLTVAGRWLRKQVADEPDPLSGPGSLTSFRAMYENGELTEAEYAKVRARMAAKLKRQTAAANPGAGLGVPPPAGSAGEGKGTDTAGPPAGVPPPAPPG